MLRHKNSVTIINNRSTQEFLLSRKGDVFVHLPNLGIGSAEDHMLTHLSLCSKCRGLIGPLSRSHLLLYDITPR